MTANDYKGKICYNNPTLLLGGVSWILNSNLNLTGKQKRFLRALGTGLDPVIQIGKGGLSENLSVQIEEVLEARELIKVRVLSNCLEEPKELAKILAKETESALVQVIGRNFLLYRPSSKKNIIDLP